ncbi:UvrD-helicase domain-containing protein [Tissierella sp.]|uniref:UvrD-helicase domain-containing protein n=1 Tax=Tissierella sp. TaxID=41274 RepID=UPI00303014E3
MTILLGIISITIIIIFFNFAQKNKIKKLLQSDTVIDEITKVEHFLKEIKSAKTEYIVYTFQNQINKKYKDTYNFFKKQPYSKIKESNVIQFKDIWENLNIYIKKWNEEYVQKELTKHKELFDDIDGKSLDEQQRYAVVVDEENNLVLAGAGSGKTLTVSAKVKYLVDRKNINPEEILLISFTRKAAEEMQERISNRLNIDVEAKTFHKLGLDIISQAHRKRPDVFDDLSGVIDKYFKKEILTDKTAMRNLIDFFGIYLKVPKDLEEFNNLGEAHDHYSNVDFETIKSKVESKAMDLRKDKITIAGERVKSIEEVMIANYLYLNGVKYTYENFYPYETGDPYRKLYRPDFYLDDYDIYLEHFGITEDFRVPWLNEIEEKKYLEGIRWKRKIHKEKGTLLIETYSYFNKIGILYKELDKLLKSHGVVYKEVDYVVIYDRLFKEKEDRYFTELKKLIQSFIGLFKSRGYSIDDFEFLKMEANKIENTFLRHRTSLFLSIVIPVYIQYQNILNSTGQIDFNDMINMATDIVKHEEVEYKLKYIIVDEYQDISVSRFNLIKHLKDKTNAKVMAVGDDWQSIYRFTGSDIDLFTNFSKYFGYSEILKIEKTYRNAQELIDIAGSFIIKNSKQLKKDLISSKHHSNPIRILGYDKEVVVAIKNAIEEIVYLSGKDAEIMILGRNNFDIDVLDSTPDFKIYKSSNSVKIKYNKYPDVKLFFLTTHRSKGLEADNVIVINLENKLLGFPNKIADDPILSLVLTDLDGFNYAEERRLFYVAITRTKNSTYLIVPDKNQSVFVKELIESFNIKYGVSTGENSIQDNPNCPKCQKGYLVLRENSTNSSKFLGCSNYPLCDTTLKNVEILNNYIKCNSCGGYMVKRRGQYGSFYGCTNYPFCQNTLRADTRKR